MEDRRLLTALTTFTGAVVAATQEIVGGTNTTTHASKPNIPTPHAGNEPTSSSSIAGSNPSYTSTYLLGTVVAILSPWGDSKISGSVFYSSQKTPINTIEKSLIAGIQGAPPGTEVTVSLMRISESPIVLGTITADNSGSGSIKLSNYPQGTTLPYPANLPAISLGAFFVLSATDSTHTPLAGGALSVAVDSPSIGSTVIPGTVVYYHASLAKSPSSIIGGFEYVSVTNPPAAPQASFGVFVAGAKPGESIDVALVNRLGNSVSVGTITVNTNGSGVLALSSYPLSIPLSIPHQTGVSQTAFPANFPKLGPGMKLVLSSVNPQTGTLTQLTATNLTG